MYDGVVGTRSVLMSVCRMLKGRWVLIIIQQGVFWGWCLSDSGFPFQIITDRKRSQSSRSFFHTRARSDQDCYLHGCLQEYRRGIVG